MAAVGNFLTTTITKLDLFSNANLLGTATGFFLRYLDGWGIATNWHVVSGRNPQNGQPRHPSGAVPDSCRYHTYRREGDRLLTLQGNVPLGDAMGGTAAWLQHPDMGQNVDVALIPLATNDVGSAKNLYDPTGHDPDMFIDLGAELFLPGFPLGFYADGVLPLWKRASLASSLEFGSGASKFCYVDTATREGMSGSPCLAISNWRHYRLDRETGKVEVIEQPLSWRLVGIYSGRKLASDAFEAQIGVVWTENLLRDILRRGVTGSINLLPR